MVISRATFISDLLGCPGGVADETIRTAFWDTVKALKARGMGHQDAQDAAADALFRILQRADRGEDLRSIYDPRLGRFEDLWYTAAVRIWIDACRKRERRDCYVRRTALEMVLGQRSVPSLPAHHLTETLEGEDFRAAVLDAIARLGSRATMEVALIDLEFDWSVSPRVIGEVLGITAAAVATRRCRYRRQFSRDAVLMRFLGVELDDSTPPEGPGGPGRALEPAELPWTPAELQAILARVQDLIEKACAAHVAERLPGRFLSPVQKIFSSRYPYYDGDRVRKERGLHQIHPTPITDSERPAKKLRGPSGVSDRELIEYYLEFLPDRVPDELMTEIVGRIRAGVVSAIRQRLGSFIEGLSADDLIEMVTPRSLGRLERAKGDLRSWARASARHLLTDLIRMHKRLISIDAAASDPHDNARGDSGPPRVVRFYSHPAVRETDERVRQGLEALRLARRLVNQVLERQRRDAEEREIPVDEVFVVDSKVPEIADAIIEIKPLKRGSIRYLAERGPRGVIVGHGVRRRGEALDRLTRGRFDPGRWKGTLDTLVWYGTDPGTVVFGGHQPDNILFLFVFVNLPRGSVSTRGRTTGSGAPINELLGERIDIIRCSDSARILLLHGFDLGVIHLPDRRFATAHPMGGGGKTTRSPISDEFGLLRADLDPMDHGAFIDTHRRKDPESPSSTGPVVSPEEVESLLLAALAEKLEASEGEPGHSGSAWDPRLN